MLINLLIMQIRLFVCLSPTRTCLPLADWHSGAVVLAAVSGRSAVGLRGLRVSQIFVPPREKLTPVKFMLAAGAYS